MRRIQQYALVILLLALSASASAGVIELSFPWGKDSSCSVTAQYWDGAQESYTCTHKFSSQEQPGN